MTQLKINHFFEVGCEEIDAKHQLGDLLAAKLKRTALVQRSLTFDKESEQWKSQLDVALVPSTLLATIRDILTNPDQLAIQRVDAVMDILDDTAARRNEGGDILDDFIP